MHLGSAVALCIVDFVGNDVMTQHLITVPSRKTEGHQRCGCGLVRWRIHDGRMWQFNTLRVLLRLLHYMSLPS